MVITSFNPLASINGKARAMGTFPLVAWLVLDHVYVRGQYLRQDMCQPVDRVEPMTSLRICVWWRLSINKQINK